jgi:hypothetical protein
MKTFSILLALAAGSLAVPAFAHTDKATPAGTEKPKKEHKICRSDTRSGSHMARTVCKTAKEWAGLENQLEALPNELTGNRDATGRAINVGGINRGAPQN